MKHHLFAATALAGLLLAVPALAQETRTIAVSVPAATHGWTGGVVYHAQKAAEEIQAAFPNIQVVVKTSPSAAAQVSALEDLTATGDLDALVILPFSSDELTGPVQAVADRGTFITVVDRGLTDPEIQDLYVAGDNIAVGSTTAKFLVDALGGKGDVVVLRGIPTVIDDERIQGFQEGLEGSDIKILDIQYANWNSDEAFSLMQDYLAKYPHIDAVWANDDDMLLGVLEAIQQSGRTEIKYALGGNGMKEIIEKVMAGDPMTPIETPYPPSMIKTAIYMTAAQFNGQAPVRGNVKLDAPLITKDNAEEYYFPDSPF
ncbi:MULTISPECIES: substrate-binding domain-containing protein [Devosia]|uniref:D-ribose-binding periplasmic protein n=1 Tax=Devosia equisanguinis TaxID=2490941 RepID=A0A447I7J0_9HYPH|nr:MULTISPECIES: substrate-binding domain-containing protein [Devosia]ODT47863.1 MAG: ABC transporter substrate-binding protein [Pelagibacterium sp. SCN 63-126]ODU86679.1 MAG: ABC transporter substrate-binding protein [Pelagibacterium sp. SCN 63-17]OJX42426.1 MAG: ABC transporter substrate-binding protein [Devosia sp. 63-57]VDS03491.1 D-ribose-binding periplasmic protein precursor [Devosia equisanguinis]